MNIQIFGSSKSFDSKKAERWFKERRIKYQYIDLPSKGLSPREYQSVKQKVGFDALVNTKCRAYEDLYMAYITPDAREEKLLEHPELFVTPIVRNGREATVGYHRKSGRLGSESLPPDRILHRCGTDRWYSVHTMDAHGEEVACVQRRAWMELPQNRFLRGIYLLVQRYLRHNVGMQGAALAFYLLFMIFPFLIFISALLGLLDLNITGMMTVLSDFLPEEVVDLLRMYFTYVTDNPSPQLMVFGLVFSIYFPMRATNSLMAAVRTAYHLGPPKGFITQWIKVLLYTVTLIVTIALTLSLMTFGERALWYTVEHFHLPEFLAKLWVTLRFPVAGAVSFLALFLLYALAQDTIQPLKNICPGVLFSLAAWMAFSWLYSYYANHFSHYSVLYGSIGAVIVVLIWLNLSAFTLILGAEMNGVLISMRKDRLEQGVNIPKT